MARGPDHPSIFALPAPAWFRLALAISLAAALVLAIGSVAMSAVDGAPGYNVFVYATALGLWVLILNLAGALLAFAAIAAYRRVRR